MTLIRRSRTEVPETWTIKCYGAMDLPLWLWFDGPCMGVLDDSHAWHFCVVLEGRLETEVDARWYRVGLSQATSCGMRNQQCEGKNARPLSAGLKHFSSNGIRHLFTV